MRKKNYNRIKVKGLVIAILVSFTFSFVVCPCAGATSMWSKTYGGTGTDSGWGDLIQTSDGGYAISGDTNSFGAGGNDYWLIKTDADGNMQWNKTYGGTGSESESAMCQTINGGYALAGYTGSFGAGGNDFWLVKTDADGNMQWNQTYGGTGTDGGIHVIQTVEGGYAIIAITASFGAGGNDVWLVKTDADGNMQWNQTYGGTSADAGWSLIQTIDGGYAIAGNTNSFGAGGRDFYFLKTDEYGVIPEGLTFGVMLLLSTVAATVGIRYLHKRTKWKR